VFFPNVYPFPPLSKDLQKVCVCVCVGVSKKEEKMRRFFLIFPAAFSDFIDFFEK